MIREDVYAAVFAFFENLTTQSRPLFKLATRKPTTWDGVSPEDQPALLMLQHSEESSKPRGLPAKWKFQIHLLLYVHTGAQNDPDIVPAQLINPLIDAIEAALQPDDVSNDACTLGGIVSHCAINGTIEIALGSQGDEAVALVPIEILTTQ